METTIEEIMKDRQEISIENKTGDRTGGMITGKITIGMGTTENVTIRMRNIEQ